MLTANVKKPFYVDYIEVIISLLCLFLDYLNTQDIPVEVILYVLKVIMKTKVKCCLT